MITNIRGHETEVRANGSSAQYRLDEHGRFLIEQYDKQPAFAGFLPGIGGPDGVPLWCLYVNRAQAISSFGVANKDHAVAEFLPANWAYQLTGIQGFRTFCMIDNQYYEPFQNDSAAASFDYKRWMRVEMDRLTICEENHTLGLRFEVTYFSPVSQSIGCLVRLLTLTNLTSKIRDIYVLDGLPLIIPAGFTEVGIKTMRRIYEAYASVRMVAGKVPFYAAKVLAHDEAEVEEVRKGNFYAAWLSDGDYLLPIEPFYDPDVIFGTDQDLVTPRQFIRQVTLDRNRQVGENKLPCAMVPFNLKLGPTDAAVLAALSGMAPHEALLRSFLLGFKTLSDFEKASRQSHQMIRSLTQPALTVSAKPALDNYARQNFLDNILRGGVPISMPSASGAALLHLYSRRHGDAERDYNFFDLPACPLSSGEGNYRDICQNRRSNIWFYPEAGDAEIRMFVNLLSADGYNPLSIQGYRWTLPESIDPEPLCPAQDAEAKAAFIKLVRHPFLPGQLLAWANYYAIEIPDRSQWLSRFLGRCNTRLMASGHEGGYWIDHWTYILDLMEAYAAVYPDRIAQTLTQKADIEWFFEPAYVLPRKQKYLRRKNGPLQLNAVVNAPAVPTPLPPVTVLGKLCSLLAVKAVSLDYEGRGIEMEAGRPGWNDAMNGLPGLFGSSTCETAEALRLARWLLHTLPQMPDTEFPEAVAALLEAVLADLKDDYDWDRSAAIRESFREKIYKNNSEKIRMVSGLQIQDLLKAAANRFEQGLNKSVDPKTGLLHTYYFHKPITAGQTDPGRVKIDSFRAHPLPLFLEGQVHWLRVCDTQQARQIYHTVRRSPLLDPQLQMYKLNECLAECSPEIGRARTFSRGWFENESVWLHMSYKYLLELLKQGLYEEFYTDAQTMLVPFMDPAVYGRSILENSSFIASSVCPDPQARGRGFVARLSGSTAEFIHIWLQLTVGPQPFRTNKGRLIFAPRPALPGAWFTEKPSTLRWNEQSIEIPENTFACALLGQILLVYHNPARKDTFGPSAVRPAVYQIENGQDIPAMELAGQLAEQIRQRQVGRIDIHLR
jgi:hypothetical protein